MFSRIMFFSWCLCLVLVHFHVSDVAALSWARLGGSSLEQPLSSYFDVDPAKFVRNEYDDNVGAAARGMQGTPEEAEAAAAMLLGASAPSPSDSTDNHYTPVPINANIFPICANVTYAAGNPDISRTLYECVTRIADPLLTASYINGSKTREVLVAYSFNNLMAVSELEGTVTMDFYFRLYWLDQRINVPTLWEAIANTTKAYMITDGVCIDPLVRNENNNLELWLPDIHFVDGKEDLTLQETLKLRPGGIMFWSRHMVVTMQQPGFVYYNYPMDTQVVGVRIESYGYNSHSMLLDFADPEVFFPGSTVTTVKPVTFISNGDKENFNTNQMWEFEGYYTEVLQPDYGTSSVAAYFAQPVVYLNIKRKSSGIINRLALPIMLMLMLVGMTFWKEMETRVDTTITILLAVSALYIVIFSNVPPIGYLTRFDKYIIEMFIMLVATVFTHQIVDRLLQKADRYPMRLLAVRIIEYLGKQFIIPFVLLEFVVTFSTLFAGSDGDLQWADVALIVLVVGLASAYIFFRELVGLKRAVRDCLVLIRVKVANPASYELSTVEMMFFNYFSYGVCSRSASHYHRWLHSKDKTYAEEERARAASLAPSSDVGGGSGEMRNSMGDRDDDGSEGGGRRSRSGSIAGGSSGGTGSLPRTARELLRAWEGEEDEGEDVLSRARRSMSSPRCSPTVRSAVVGGGAGARKQFGSDFGDTELVALERGQRNTGDSTASNSTTGSVPVVSAMHTGSMAKNRSGASSPSGSANGSFRRNTSGNFRNGSSAGAANPEVGVVTSNTTAYEL